MATSLGSVPTGGGLCLAWGAVLFPFAWVALSFVYWTAVLHAGLLPIHADSIAIPLFYDLVAAPFMIVLLALWSWPAWSSQQRRVSLLAWNRERPVTSCLATLFYGGSAIILICDAIYSILFLHPVEWLNLLLTLPLAWWNFLLRATVILRQRKLA